MHTPYYVGLILT